MDARRLSRAVLAGVAVSAVAACAQQPRLAAVSHSTRIAYTPADRECMARAMYFESNKSSSDGMLAVGTVIVNRVQSGRYGPSVCGVVAAKRQFAPGVMSRSMTGPSADVARATADQVLAGGKRHPNVKEAMHFHTAGLRFRYPNMHYVLVAGGNAFYEKRSSDGGGRAANARSLALALAHSRANPTVPSPIQVAAATPIEGGASPTELAAGARGGGETEQPIRVATLIQPRSAQPAAAPQPATAQPAPAAPAASTHPFARAKAATAPAPVSQPTAYAQVDDRPVVAFPKIAPAPAHVVQPAAPMLASVAPEAKAAPVAATAKVASREERVERKSEPRVARAAPAKRVISPEKVEPALASTTPAAAPEPSPVVADAAPARNPIADAFSAFQ